MQNDDDERRGREEKAKRDQAMSNLGLRDLMSSHSSFELRQGRRRISFVKGKEDGKAYTSRKG